MKTLYLIDAYALIFKYYYAFIGRPMRNRDGLNTSIIYGFTKFLRDIQKREHPDLLGVAFDPKGGCFRKRLYSQYKANRPDTPEDIINSVPYVKRIIQAMNVPILEIDDFEADDVIGTLAFKASEEGYDVFMVTPDKDYGQLVGKNRRIYKQKGDSVEIIDSNAIKEKYGIDDPMLVRDILALWGDSADNIPGVPGIGEKGASKLVQTWGTIENILDNISSIKGKTAENIASCAESLRLAKELTAIRLDVPVEFDSSIFSVREPDREKLRELYDELDFRSFAFELSHSISSGQPQVIKQEKTLTPPKKENKVPVQADLFNPQPDLFQVQVESMYSSISSVKHNYRTITKAEELIAMVDRIAACPIFCFDCETTGFDVFTCRVVGMSFAIREHEAWFVYFTPQNESEFAQILKPLFEDASVDKIGQNMKFDMLFLKKLGIEVRGTKYDTMLMHYILDPESRHGMDYLSERYLRYTPIHIDSLIGKGQKQLTMDMVPLAQISEYAAEDADVTFQLYGVLRKMLEDQSQMNLYLQIEEPMIQVLVDMEWEGVSINTQALHQYSKILTQRLEVLESEIREMSDTPDLNINSSRQLGEVLFAKMKIASKPKMTKTKQYCTDEEYLQGFAEKNEIVRKILDYRGVKKLVSTYVDALPALVNPVTGKIHTSYNQAVTATGRLSSTNPNLQNIPIREEIGKPIRDAFIPSPGRVLISADYSQVELRLMAHLSQDENLVNAFRCGDDVHASTAAKVFRKDINDVTKEERRRAKTANFGIIYGISAFGLSQRLGISRTEAKELIDGYFESYPGVHDYMQKVIDDARQNGFVQTMFGRKRMLRDINSANANVRGLAERNAINAPIQGSAADIMKKAMIGVWKAFKDANLRSRLILQVHDEIVIDTYLDEQETVKSIVEKQMQEAAQLLVPLVAECGVGNTWLEAH